MCLQCPDQGHHYLSPVRMARMGIAVVATLSSLVLQDIDSDCAGRKVGSVGKKQSIRRQSRGILRWVMFPKRRTREGVADLGCHRRIRSPLPMLILPRSVNEVRPSSFDCHSDQKADTPRTVFADPGIIMLEDVLEAYSLTLFFRHADVYL